MLASTPVFRRWKTTTAPTPRGLDRPSITTTIVCASAPPWVIWDPARHRLNLTVRADCHVQRLVFEGTRATGVVVESGGETFTLDADQIILSAGAVGTPQILMLSGVGPAEHLRSMGIPVVHDAPGVGQNLRDHPKVYVTWKAQDDYAPEWDRHGRVSPFA